MIDIYDNSLLTYWLNKTDFKEIIDEMISIGSEGNCEKSKRVSAIVYQNGFSVIETNSPPFPFVCQKNEKCKKACNQLCVHAEERAILSALRKYGDVDFCICIHLKIVNGQPAFSGSPSCITCARKLLECNIRYMYLWQETGWQRWAPKEFYEDTLSNLKLL
jgi:deoxycytidylate deaminase